MKALSLFVVIFFLLLLYASSVMSQTPDELYNLAVNAYKSGDFKSASRHLEEYVKLRPEPQAYYLLGYSYYKLKIFDKAESAFNEAYFIDPELVPSRLASDAGFPKKSKILGGTVRKARRFQAKKQSSIKLKRGK